MYIDLSKCDNDWVVSVQRMCPSWMSVHFRIYLILAVTVRTHFSSRYLWPICAVFPYKDALTNHTFTLQTISRKKQVLLKNHSVRPITHRRWICIGLDFAVCAIVSSKFFLPRESQQDISRERTLDPEGTNLRTRVKMNIFWENDDCAKEFSTGKGKKFLIWTSFAVLNNERFTAVKNI